MGVEAVPAEEAVTVGRAVRRVVVVAAVLG